MFPQLTTVHQDVVGGIILNLSHAELNSHADVTHFGRKTWGSLITLWQKKDKPPKKASS